MGGKEEQDGGQQAERPHLARQYKPKGLMSEDV